MSDESANSPEANANERVAAADESQEVEVAPLGIVARVARTLMLLASTFVIVVALPLAAWQMTTLSEVETRVEGRAYVVRVVKRHGQHSVEIDDPAGSTGRIALMRNDGRRLDGRVTLEASEDGRVVTIQIGELTRRLQFRDGSYELEPVD